MKRLLLLALLGFFSLHASDGGGADKYGRTDTGADPKNAEYVRWYNEYYHSHYNDYGKTNPPASSPLSEKSGGGGKADADSVVTVNSVSSGANVAQNQAREIKSQPASAKAAQKALPIILDAGAGKVTCLENFSDDRVAAGYADGTVRVWNPAVAADALGHVVVLAGHTDYVTGLVVLNDDCIVTASIDGTIRVWDLKNDAVRVLTDHTDAVNCLIKLSDGRIASGSSDKTIRVWKLNSSENPSQDVVVLRGHTKQVTCLIQLYSSIIVSASDDKTVRVWDLRGDSSFVLDDHCWAWDLYSLLNNRLVVRTQRDVKVYDPNVIGDRPITLNISGRPNAFLALQDGRVISGTRNGTLEIFHAAALGDDAVNFQVQNSSVVDSLIELKNGLVAIGLGNGVIQVWSEFVSEKDPITFRGHTDSILHLRELSDGCIVSGSSDGTIRIWPNEELASMAAEDVAVDLVNLLVDAEPADEEEEFDSERDQKVEELYNVVKIPALLQKMIKRPGLDPEYLQNCHFYAMFNAYLLNSALEKGDDFDQGDPTHNPFQSEEAFQVFLQAFDLTQEFNRAAYVPISDERLESIMQSIDPSISCIIPGQVTGIVSRHDREEADFEKYLNINRRYQVFMYKKLRHWVTFGIDYSKEEIYFVDSVKNYKKQKYSSTDMQIIWSIRDAMFALKKSSSDNRAKSVETGGGSK